MLLICYITPMPPHAFNILQSKKHLFSLIPVVDPAQRTRESGIINLITHTFIFSDYKIQQKNLLIKHLKLIAQCKTRKEKQNKYIILFAFLC